MRHSIFLVLPLVLLVCLAGDASAGLEQGEKAFHQGDFERAVEELRGPAEAGDAAAQHLLGRILWTRCDMASVRWIHTSAEAHFFPAELDVGLMYFMGLFHPVDSVKGLEWLKRAAAHSAGEQAARPYATARAQYLLGRVLLQVGSAQEREKATGLVRFAAEAGLDEAQAFYSHILTIGDGVPVDRIEALKHYLLFVKQNGHAEAFKLGLGSMDEPLSDEEMAEVKTRVSEWLAAKDAGSLGWAFEHDARMTQGEKKLRIWGKTFMHTYEYLAREARDDSCVGEGQWLRACTRVKPWTPDAEAWVERWTIDTCGVAREFLIDVRPHERGFHWTVQGPAAQGAPSPQELLEQTWQSVVNEDLETLPKLIAPDERPYLNEWLIGVMMYLRAHILADGVGEDSSQASAMSQDLLDHTASLLKTVETALGKHGLSTESLRNPPPPRSLHDAPAIAAWWKKVAPDLDHTALLTDLLYEEAELSPDVALAFTRPTRVFEPYCGEPTALEIEGDVAIVVINNGESKMRKIGERWYLSIVGGPKPARFRPPGGGVGAASTVPTHESAFERGEAAYEQRNYEAAREAWTRLAEDGGQEAQVRLGMLYEQGRGVASDLSQAHLWYTLASVRGSGEGRARLPALEKRMSPSQREEARQLFTAWMDRAAKMQAADPVYPLFPILEEGKWGFIDVTGRMVVPPRYDDVRQPEASTHRHHGVDAKADLQERIETNAWPTTDALVGVKLGERWGFAGRDGLAIAPQYDGVGPFREGLGMVRLGEERRFIDARGKTVISAEVGGTLWFEDGVAPACVDGRWGLIDRQGRYVLALAYDWIEPGSMAFHAPGVWKIGRGDKFGIARSDGRILVEPRLEAASWVTEGLIAVREGRDWECIDVDTGELALPIRFSLLGHFEGGFAEAATDDGYGIVDRTGRFVFGPIKDSSITEFNGPLKIVRIEGLSGILDARSGSMVVDRQYTSILPVANGRAVFASADGWQGYLNGRGEVVIEPRFTTAADFSEGLAAASVDGGPLGYLDREGAWVIKPHLEIAMPFRQGLALVVEQGENRYRYVNQEGQTVYSFSQPRDP